MKIISFLALCLYLASTAQALSADDVPVSVDESSVEVAIPQIIVTPVNKTSDLASSVVLDIDPVSIPVSVPVPVSSTTENDDASTTTVTEDQVTSKTTDSEDETTTVKTTVGEDETTSSTTADSEESNEDAKHINPDECGVRSNKTSSLRKRFTSSKRANQNDFGWMVLLQGPDGVVTGSLINSQWVLTRARGIE
jgi:hypothetical protein